MSDLSDIFYLPRSGRYTTPLNSNERLPFVWGDLTDGSAGIWVAPCINTASYVYCFAGHEVLSVANGNSITVYENGLVLDPGMYTFDEANDYEGAGTIATITFTTPKTGSTITVRGKGKPTTTGGATLMENIIDIVYDFLTVHNDWTSSDFEATKKAKAKAVFTAQSYKAAGVIDQDDNIDQIFTDMMASFAGSWYRDGKGRIVLEIDTGSVSQYDLADVIRHGEYYFLKATQRIENVINQCPVSFAYSYATSAFLSHTDDTAHADAASQGIFVVREPTSPFQAYWCRDITTMQAIQDIIVGRFAYPLWEVEIRDNLRRVGVDRGDIVSCTVKCLFDEAGDYLLNHLWQVQSVRPDYAEGAITFRLLQTGQYLMSGVSRDTTEY